MWCEPVGPHLAEGRAFRVLAPLTWHVGAKGSGLSVTVPTGFTFDASVPWWGRWYQDPLDPKLRRASALHDWALANGWRRIPAASLFEDALYADGVGRVRRLILSLAVIVNKWR